MPIHLCVCSMKTASMVTSIGITKYWYSTRGKGTTITALLQHSVISLLFPKLTFSFLQTSYIHASFEVLQQCARGLHYSGVWYCITVHTASKRWDAINLYHSITFQQNVIILHSCHIPWYMHFVLHATWNCLILRSFKQDPSHEGLYTCTYQLHSFFKVKAYNDSPMLIYYCFTFKEPKSITILVLTIWMFKKSNSPNLRVGLQPDLGYFCIIPLFIGAYVLSKSGYVQTMKIANRNIINTTR
jgi:hypothetical protein